MITKSDIFIIIPAYNENSTIRTVVASLLSAGYKNMVVVDDCSSVPLQDALAGLQVVYIRHKVNLGQGAALQTGFDYAKSKGAKTVVTFDADGQHSSDDIDTLVTPVINGEVDIVFGSRFLKVGQNNIPVVRKSILTMARGINFLFSGLMLTDAHNGLRALSEKALNTIRLSENRMAHASEILFEVKKNKLSFAEVHVHVKYTAESRRKGQSSLEALRILMDIILHKLFG